MQGHDYNEALKLVKQLRNCNNKHSVIADVVSFHFFFDVDHPPEKVLSDFEVSTYDVECEYNQETEEEKQGYKEQAKLDYPINVARNIARQVRRNTV